MKKVETEKLAKVVGGNAGNSKKSISAMTIVCKKCKWDYPREQIDAQGLCPNCRGNLHHCR